MMGMSPGSRIRANPFSNGMLLPSRGMKVRELRNAYRRDQEALRLGSWQIDELRKQLEEYVDEGVFSFLARYAKLRLGKLRSLARRVWRKK